MDRREFLAAGRIQDFQIEAEQRTLARLARSNPNENRALQALRTAIRAIKPATFTSLNLIHRWQSILASSRQPTKRIAH
jgi:hypothetical protein